MPAQQIGTRSVQRVATRKQALDRAGILLRRAERPSRDQCVADVAMHLATEVGHDPGEAGEGLGEQGVEANVADVLGDAGRADQIKEDDDPLFLARVIVPAGQEAAEDVRADQLNDRGQ